MSETIKIDWNEAPKWANYYAIDDNGAAYWYEGRPITSEDDGEWWDEEGRITYDGLFKVQCDWKQAIWQRPNKEAGKPVFKVCDRVKVVRKVEDPIWVSYMDRFVDSHGMVVGFLGDGVTVQVPDQGCWCFPPDALEHADQQPADATPTRIPIAWIEPATPKTRAATFADVPEEATAAVYLYKSGDRMGISHKTDWAEWDSASKQHEVIGYFVGQEWRDMSEVCDEALPASMAEAKAWEGYMNDLGTLFWRRGSDLYCVHDDGDCLMRNDKPRDITPTKHIGRLHFDLSGIGGAK